LAVAIQTLAETERGRLETAVMNIDKGLDKEYEKQSLQEILKAHVHCLQGISEQKAAEVWKHLGVVTVQDLANRKYFRWAQAVVTAAKFEQAPPTTSSELDTSKLFQTIYRKWRRWYLVCTYRFPSFITK
jgi:hypothetical protein